MSPEQAAAEAGTRLSAGGLRMLSIGGGEGERPPGNDVRVVPLLEEMVGAYRPALMALTPPSCC